MRAGTLRLSHEQRTKVCPRVASAAAHVGPAAVGSVIGTPGAMQAGLTLVSAPPEPAAPSARGGRRLMVRLQAVMRVRARVSRNAAPLPDPLPAPRGEGTGSDLSPSPACG